MPTRAQRSPFARFAALALLLAGCANSSKAPFLGGKTEKPLPSGAEARSLAGEALYPPPIDESKRSARELALTEARAALAAAPGDADAEVMLARRLGNLGQFREEIEILTLGMEQHPLDARMFRHRGHRQITLRHFDLAVEDLDRAAWLVRGHPDQIEPALEPNERNVPLDTLNQNVFYHLGLAHFLRAQYDDALAAFYAAREFSKNPDALCSATNWIYLTLRRLHRDDEAKRVLAPITKDLDVIEYHAYHQLVLVYKGELDADKLLAETKPGVDFATIGFGVGSWHMAEGRRERALEIYRLVAKSEMWHAFGRIAAEVELDRTPK